MAVGTTAEVITVPGGTMGEVIIVPGRIAAEAITMVAATSVVIIAEVTAFAPMRGMAVVAAFLTEAVFSALEQASASPQPVTVNIQTGNTSIR